LLAIRYNFVYTKNMEVQPLKEWRLRQYWSVRRLAKEAGVSVDAVVRAERTGKSWDITKRRIADALGVQIEQIAEFAAATYITAGQVEGV
jgi:lambda repressor-like predicted transcriptional regulator